MPKYVFHIGPHKTGTTYLQAIFKAMKADLQNRGIHYPLQWAASADDSSQRGLYEALLTKSPEIEAEFNKLNNSAHDIILLSSEDLSDLPMDSVRFLRHIIGNSLHKIVFYCRRWSETIQSSWQEEVKSGSTETFLEIVCSQMLNPQNHHAMNFLLRLDRFERFFGIKNIFLVSYNNIIEKKMDLASHFFSNFLDWNDAPIPRLGRLNASLALLDTEIIRALHSIHLGKHGERERRITARYLDRASAADAVKLKCQVNEFLSYVKISEKIEPLKSLADSVFARYGKCLVEPKNSNNLFSQKDDIMPFIRPDYQLVQSIHSAIFDIYDRIIS